MLVAEERIKALDFMDRFKLAVVSADPGTWVSKMFPNWSGEQKATEEAPPTDDIDLEDTADTTFVFENEDVTPEEAEAALAEMMAEGGGTLSWDDLDDSDDGGWV